MSVSDTLRKSVNRLDVKGRATEFLKPPPAYQGRQRTFLVIVLVVLCLAPMVIGGNDYKNGLINQVMIQALLALGFWWCFSLSGQFTFGVFAIYAGGAYVTVWVANSYGGFWVGMVASVIVCGALGAITRLGFNKLSPIFFAIATMAIGGLLLIIFREWTSFTGGYNGTTLNETPTLFGFTFDSAHKLFYVLVAALGLCWLGTILFLRSPAYRDLVMSRDKGPVAATAGIKPAVAQLIAFVVGSAIQGLAGSLFAANAGYFSLESFSIDISLSVLLMVLLGGAKSIYGPLIGAAVLVYLPELLRDLATWAEVIYAVLVLAIVIAFPGGIADLRRIVTKQVVRRAPSK